MKEIDVREQNGGRTTDAACDADYHEHCACPKTCECGCHHRVRQDALLREAFDPFSFLDEKAS